MHHARYHHPSPRYSVHGLALIGMMIPLILFMYATISFRAARSFCPTLGRHFHFSAVQGARWQPSRLDGDFRRFAGASEGDGVEFKPGDKIQVEVLSFGPLGASVDVIGRSHDANGLISESDPPLGAGLILQKEIQYFRQARDNVDVVRGEVLPAYVERIRENGRIDVGLRAFGGKAKADEASEQILKRLRWTNAGVLPVGDKSQPGVIAKEFPGLSKSAFKRALASLYKRRLVQPGPDSITLIRDVEKQTND